MLYLSIFSEFNGGFLYDIFLVWYHVFTFINTQHFYQILHKNTFKTEASFLYGVNRVRGILKFLPFSHVLLAHYWEGDSDC